MKSELNGYAGRILEIDLTQGKVESTSLDTNLASNYMGGKGMAARYLYDHLDKRCDPFAPQNMMIFATGPLTGTLVPGSGRCIVSTKSPATGYWLDANCGGSFGPEMKMAGYDALVIQGKAPRPMIVVVDGDEVGLREATDLWGKDTFFTHQWIRSHLGEEFRVACIGEAGEKGVRFANIISQPPLQAQSTG